MTSKMNMNRAAIRELRQKEHLTYREIAERLKLSVTYVQVLNGSDGMRGGKRVSETEDRRYASIDRQIKHYHGMGLPPALIAKLLEETAWTVRARMKKLDLESPREENRRLFREGKRRCSGCHQIRPISEFYTSKIGLNGYSPACRACVSASNIARVAQARESD